MTFETLQVINAALQAHYDSQVKSYNHISGKRVEREKKYDCSCWDDEAPDDLKDIRQCVDRAWKMMNNVEKAIDDFRNHDWH